MATLIGKTAGKKLFEKHLEQYAPQDPLYEFYTDDRGKQKRRQRALPPGLSKRDARILKSVQRRAHYLDKGFNFCGFRCGWTFVIGIIPVVGDITNMTLNYCLVIRKAKKADIPPWLLRRMQVHNIISTGVGFIPLVGDVIVAVYKANSRNAALLEEFLRIRGEEFLKLNTGPDGQALNAGQGKKGWTWLKKNGVSQKDAEQVKPGAGLTEGEVVPSVPIDADLVEEPVGGASAPVVSSSSGARDTNGNGGSVTQTTAKGTPPPPGKIRKNFSLFGNGKKVATPEGSASQTEGRFVENIG